MSVPALQPRPPYLTDTYRRNILRNSLFLVAYAAINTTIHGSIALFPDHEPPRPWDPQPPLSDIVEDVHQIIDHVTAIVRPNSPRAQVVPIPDTLDAPPLAQLVRAWQHLDEDNNFNPEIKTFLRLELFLNPKLRKAYARVIDPEVRHRMMMYFFEDCQRAAESVDPDVPKIHIPEFDVLVRRGASDGKDTIVTSSRLISSPGWVSSPSLASESAKEEEDGVFDDVDTDDDDSD